MTSSFQVSLSVFRCKKLQTIVNLFLVNLAVADILVLAFCAPFSILQVFCVRIAIKLYDLVSGCNKYLVIWNNNVSYSCLYSGCGKVSKASI